MLERCIAVMHSVGFHGIYIKYIYIIVVQEKNGSGTNPKMCVKHISLQTL